MEVDSIGTTALLTGFEVAEFSEIAVNSLKVCCDVTSDNS